MAKLVGMLRNPRAFSDDHGFDEEIRRGISVETR